MAAWILLEFPGYKFEGKSCREEWYKWVSAVMEQKTGSVFLRIQGWFQVFRSWVAGSVREFKGQVYCDKDNM